MKIKKYTIPIFILVILFFGLFSLMFQANASVVNPNEPCNSPSITSSTNQPCQPAGRCPVTGLGGVLCRISDFFGDVLPLLISLGVLYFIWGIVQYFIGDNEEAKTKGKERIIFGIIGLAVIISVWGLVYILVDTLDIRGSAPDVTNLVPTSSPGCSLGTKLQGLLDYATCVIGKSVVPFVFALAIIVFVWGTIKFLIIDASEEKKREEGKQFMLWGIIALAVMISIWGLVAILGDTFDINTTFIPQVKP